jgi:outer membrane lipoprotein-sorting protein
MKAVGEHIVRQLRQGLLAIFPCLAAIICLGGALAGPAYGYVLPGPQILDLMSDKISGIKTLRVDQRVTVVDPTVSAEPVTFQETLNYIFPDRFRSDSVHQESRRIHVVSRGQSLTVVDGTIRDDGQAHYDQYKDLLLNNSAYLLQKALYNHRIDVGITSLGRLGDQVVFVIGARYPDESVSQIWVDQERLVPLRWLNVRQSGTADLPGDHWDFVYSHWQKVDGTHYPFKIETFHNQQLIRRIEVTKVDTGAAIDSALFNIARLRTEYERQVEQPDDKPSPSDMDEVQRTIEDFKKKFEP